MNKRFFAWKNLWEEKGRFNKENFKLRDLINMNGFDKGLGRMNEASWLLLASLVIEMLDLSKDDSLLEVGCGCGAMLLPISLITSNITGCDYSFSLVKISKSLIKGRFIKAEAGFLPFCDNKFDKSLANGVFHYFPDYKYAKMALSELVRVTNKNILITDIPDLEKKGLSERRRSELLKENEKKQLKKDKFLTHLYYKKEFFSSFANKASLNIKITDQDIKGYGNSPFRFNVLISK